MTKKQQYSHHKINGGSSDIIGRVTLYNQQNEIVGNIYPRRAKQLVLNGRAVWLDEGHTLQVAPNIMDTSSEIMKEENSMNEDSIYPTNGSPKPAAHTLSEADALLMYQAKQNVKDKRNLFKHIFAFAATWLVLGIIYGFISYSTTHPLWWRASNIINSLNAVRSYLPEEGHADISNAVSFMTSYFRHSYVPDIWYVIVGVMLAWGAWIAIRVAKRITKNVAMKFRTNSARKGKPDPVIQEYNRLRSMATEETL